MPVAHHVRPDGILVLERSGVVTTSNEDTNLDERLKDVNVVPDMKVLVDSRGVVQGDSVEVVKHLAAIARATTAQLDCGALALVVNSDVEYGMARMYMALTETFHSNTRVFRDYEEALSWLRSQTAEPADLGSSRDAAKDE